jgi:dTDP-4-dehydrorhamnose reductase
MERLLVTGTDGIVGSNVALALAGRAEVSTTFDARPAAIEGCRNLGPSPADAHVMGELVRESRCQAIVHTCELSHASWDCDVRPPCDGEREAASLSCLVAAAQAAGVYLAVVASDVVFTGPRLFHEEKFTPTASSPRAVAARRLEEAAAGAELLLVRTHAFGWSPFSEVRGFAERAWDVLEAGHPLPAGTQRHATPILASDLAEVLSRAMRLKLTGLYHFSGSERVNPQRFAIELASAAGWNTRLVQSEPVVETGPRPREESSLNGFKARREMKMPMPLLRDGLLRFVREASDGFRARIQQSAGAGLKRAA